MRSGQPCLLQSHHLIDCRRDFSISTDDEPIDDELRPGEIDLFVWLCEHPRKVWTVFANCGLGCATTNPRERTISSSSTPNICAIGFDADPRGRNQRKLTVIKAAPRRAS